jgi:hypothetical protein
MVLLLFTSPKKSKQKKGASENIYASFNQSGTKHRYLFYHVSWLRLSLVGIRRCKLLTYPTKLYLKENF